MQKKTNIRIILFDDVYTTGSTLNSAKQCLAEAGYSNITSLTLCRDWHLANYLLLLNKILIWSLRKSHFGDSFFMAGGF